MAPTYNPNTQLWGGCWCWLGEGGEVVGDAPPGGGRGPSGMGVYYPVPFHVAEGNTESIGVRPVPQCPVFPPMLRMASAIRSAGDRSGS